MHIIECDKLCVNFENRPILEDISFTLPDKSFTVVFGPNGAGKTTFLRVLIGEVKPSSGVVKLLGGEVGSNLRFIGYVPQGVFALRNFPITVLKTVMMGRLRQIGLFRRPTAKDFELCRTALEDVGLSSFADKYLSELSGGERQRVFIARALAGEPRILLLDEATSGVDIGAKESLYDLLVRLKQKMSVIFVTHDISVVSRDVDTVVCLNRTLVSHGKPEQALSEEAMACMYGDKAALFSHCDMAHVHVHKHE